MGLSCKDLIIDVCFQWKINKAVLPILNKNIKSLLYLLFFFSLLFNISCWNLWEKHFKLHLGVDYFTCVLFSFLTAPQWGCNIEYKQDGTFPVWKLWTPTFIITKKSFEIKPKSSP